MKTVIQVFKNGYSNVVTDHNGNFHGIGDFLRSTLGMYNLSKIHNFNLIVDLSIHPIRKFFKCVEHEYSNIVKEKINHINVINLDNNILNYINQSNEEVIVFFGWFGTEVYDTPITPDAQIFMKNLLVPNECMREYIDQQMGQIPFKDFNIIHYRLGDDELVRNTIHNNNYNLDHIIQKMEKNDILLSDSSNFKEYVKKNNIDIFMFDNAICHLGFHSNDHDDKDNDKIKDTLFEFFLLSYASKIKSHSIYSWESGFTKAISFIYQIPLESQINIRLT